jgi:para-aminobenzoate synthetase component 1
VKSFFYSNDYPHQPSSFDCVLAVDAFFDKTDYHNAFEDLKQYQQTAKDWLWLFIV